MAQETITLGAHEVIVYPQRHAYLTNKIGKYVDQLAANDLDISNANGLFAMLGDESYDLLAALIPQYGKRCPKYEYLGYGSQEALDAGEYDEEQDKSPTFEEIIEAFTVSARVQRFDTLKILGKVFDPKLIRSWINARMAETLTKSVSLRSPQDGATPLTSSGTPSPTSTGNTDSLSPDSKVSKQHTDDAQLQNVSS